MRPVGYPPSSHDRQAGAGEQYERRRLRDGNGLVRVDADGRIDRAVGGHEHHHVDLALAAEAEVGYSVGRTGKAVARLDELGPDEVGDVAEVAVGVQLDRGPDTVVILAGVEGGDPDVEVVAGAGGGVLEQGRIVCGVEGLDAEDVGPAVAVVVGGGGGRDVLFVWSMVLSPG